MREYPLTFETFKRQVNNAVQRRLGCSIYDLPDSIDFNDYWNMVEAATEDLLNENGFELSPY